MGKRYSGPNSVRPTQAQEGDLTTGGTAPGGTVAFMGAASQWANSDSASHHDPITAAHMMHYGLADETPAEKGDVPVHPGLRPALFHTARDANYIAPDGQTPPCDPNGRARGQDEVIIHQPRGDYVA